MLELSRKRGVYQVSLPEMCKGKVEIGEYGFLFQSVSTPAVVVQHKKEDEITSGLDDDDVIFFSLLGFFLLLPQVDVVDLDMQPRPELLDQEEVEELIAEYLDLEVEEPEEPIAEPSEEPETDENAVVDPNKVAEKVESKEPEKPEPTDKPTPQEKQEVSKKLLHLRT